MIIKYDPNSIENIPIFLNSQIEKHKDQKYLMFIFDDIAKELKNQQDFFNRYVNLMKKFQLPFAFYPYYIHFNKVFPTSFSVPSAKMRFVINGQEECDVVNQTTYGMMILDVEKITSMNFKFSDKFAKCFYIQELIEECFKNQSYFSSSWFLDVPKSYELVNSTFKSGFVIDNEIFQKEKEEFLKKYNLSSEPANDFIKKLSDKCKELKERSLSITINGTGV